MTTLSGRSADRPERRIALERTCSGEFLPNVSSIQSEQCAIYMVILCPTIENERE